MSQSNTSSLGVTLAGVRLASPLGVGAVGLPNIELRHLTPERHTDLLLEHAQAGAGFICLPLATHVPDEMLAELEKKARSFNYSWEPAQPAYMKIEEQGLEGLYLFGSPRTPPKRVARRFNREVAKMIEILKQNKPPGVPLVANISGLGAFSETFSITAEACEDAGVDLIELNLSCPMAVSLEEAPECYFKQDFPLILAGFLLGDQPELVGRITKRVTEAVNIPVGVKLSPETGFPRIIEVARKAKEAGAKFINCGNMGMTIAPPDIYRRGKPKWLIADGNPFVPAGGSWLRPIIYKQIAAISKFVPGIDLIATGGLTSPQHIVEAMMLGAKATEMVTGVLYHGRDLIRKSNEFLLRYMKEQGYGSVEEFIGLGLEYVKSGDKIKVDSGKMVAEVDQEKCVGCGICTDSICLASYMDEGFARIKVDDCLGCGMCVAICPEGAISLKVRE
ncbi:MAG: 4Fe-4S binding protein [Chloroflexota bacterium]|nr:4Fe-4S binding protein [Chloroflexota bacterium]